MNHFIQLEQKCRNADLFQAIISNCPQESAFFYWTELGTTLPFYYPEQNGISFPFIIHNDEPINPHREPLLSDLRLNSGKHLYNGHIYRLLEIDDQKNWHLSVSRYFDILNSADALSFYLKIAYINQTEDLFHLELEKWKKRFNQVRNNQFRDYVAGLAISAPLFQILPNGGLKLLFARNSAKKATGFGQKHICPAGMMECWEQHQMERKAIDDRRENNQETITNNLMSLHHFLALLGKELLEETLFIRPDDWQNNPYFHLIEPFFESQNQYGHQYLSELLSHQILPNWHPIVQDLKNQPSSEALLQVLNYSSNHIFYIIDIFNFRPEFILPIYLKSKINEQINWEYEDVQTATWHNEGELERWVGEQWQDWCSAGIASAYLGAKKYFQQQRLKS